jgi:hypothetical protein
MEWKFWRRDQTAQTSGRAQKLKLHGPKELPQTIGQYLVTREKMDPDLVWSLKCVLRPHADHKSISDCRIFSPSQVDMQDIRIIDYTSLDDHADLILFHGWFDSQTNQVKLQKGVPDLAA